MIKKYAFDAFFSDSLQFIKIDKNEIGLSEQVEQKYFSCKLISDL